MSNTKWKQEFTLDAASPIHTLAQYAKDPARETLMLALCQPDNFETAFEAELNGPGKGTLEDLTDEQKAFCEGWAYLANKAYGSDAKAIRDAIDQHTAVPLSG